MTTEQHKKGRSTGRGKQRGRRLEDPGTGMMIKFPLSRFGLYCARSQFEHFQQTKRQRDKERLLMEVLCPFDPLSLCVKAIVQFMPVRSIAVGAILAGSALSIILAVAVRRHHPAFRWTLICPVCMVKELSGNFGRRAPWFLNARKAL